MHTHTITIIPYSRKVWWVESLANHLRFAKLKPSKVVVTFNNPLVIYSFAKLFSTKHFKIMNSPNILPAKLSHYTVPTYIYKPLYFAPLCYDMPPDALVFQHHHVVA